MKTKRVWVYLVDDSTGGSPLAFASYSTARREHKADSDYGYTVSPIVRVYVPLPGGKGERT